MTTTNNTFEAALSLLKTCREYGMDEAHVRAPNKAQQVDAVARLKAAGHLARAHVVVDPELCETYYEVIVTVR